MSFVLIIGKNKLEALRIWDKLTGYGPSLYDFMKGGGGGGNSLLEGGGGGDGDGEDSSNELLELPDISTGVLVKVNKIDVKMRYKIVDNGFYKAKGNRLDSIIAEKIHNKDFGWVYKVGTPSSLSDACKEACTKGREPVAKTSLS